MRSSHRQPDAEQVLVHAVPAQRAARLAELGLTESNLADAVRYGAGHLADCTSNDTRWLRGMIPTGKIIRRFRELHPSWDVLRPSGYEITRVPGEAHAVTVAAGTENTGSLEPNAYPSNRSAKGRKTKEAVARNQASFYSYAPEAWGVGPVATPDRVAPPDQTWLLLFYVDSDNVINPEIRFELSLPALMDDQGYVVRWKERIVCDPIANSAFTVELGDLDDDAFDADDFPVTLRSV